jgi:hypothetical protein
MGDGQSILIYLIEIVDRNMYGELPYILGIAAALGVATIFQFNLKTRKLEEIISLDIK